jgi:hypothetical protein
MVFHVTYHQIQDYNIQHVHESPSLTFRTRRSYHKIRGSNVLADLCISTGIGQRTASVKKKPHPAPAFRTFSEEEVESVVNRLNKCPARTRRQSLPVANAPRILSKEEEAKLNARLLQPTVAAKIRAACLTVKPTQSLPEIVKSSCDRYGKAPSSRYYPDCYENVSQHNFSYRYWNGSTNTFWWRRCTCNVIVWLINFICNAFSRFIYIDTLLNDRSTNLIYRYFNMSSMFVWHDKFQSYSQLFCI